jgi:hypothetical protein
MHDMPIRPPALSIPVSPCMPCQSGTGVTLPGIMMVRQCARSVPLQREGVGGNRSGYSHGRRGEFMNGPD